MYSLEAFPLHLLSNVSLMNAEEGLFKMSSNVIFQCNIVHLFFFSKYNNNNNKNTKETHIHSKNAGLKTILMNSIFDLF